MWEQNLCLSVRNACVHFFEKSLIYMGHNQFFEYNISIFSWFQKKYQKNIWMWIFWENRLQKYQNLEKTWNNYFFWMFRQKWWIMAIKVAKIQKNTRINVKTEGMLLSGIWHLIWMQNRKGFQNLCRNTRKSEKKISYLQKTVLVYFGDFGFFGLFDRNKCLFWKILIYYLRIALFSIF